MAYQNYLVYIAYGGPTFSDETIFSILSYFQLKADSQDTAVLIYTDTPAYFRKFFSERSDVLYQDVPAAQWQQWRGERKFIHRAKVEVIRHAMTTYQGNFLYLDSDTILLQDPTPLFKQIAAGQRFMHVK